MSETNLRNILALASEHGVVELLKQTLLQSVRMDIYEAMVSLKVRTFFYGRGFDNSSRNTIFSSE